MVNGQLDLAGLGYRPFDLVAGLVFDLIERDDIQRIGHGESHGRADNKYGYNRIAAGGINRYELDDFGRNHHRV